VYAIIPRVRRLEVSLRFGFFGWFVSAASILTVIYLQFYQSFRSIGLTPSLNLSRWALTPENISFLVILFMIITLCFYISIKGLTKSNIVKFREFVFELVREKRYSELFSFVERFLDQLERIYVGNYPLNKLQKYFEGKSNDTSSFMWSRKANGAIEFNKNFEKKPLMERKKLLLFRQISSILPTYENEVEVANEIATEILLNRNTVCEIAVNRPYLALKILDKSFHQNEEFFDTYLRCLASDTKSILYHEVRNNQNLRSYSEYDLPESNRLLYYLFNDCSVAEKYGAYKPIGDYVIKKLDEIDASMVPDQYNTPMGEFAEKGQWESELLLGINFFDIMITSALYQNIRWHMWLYYYSYFVENIINNIASDDKFVDQPIEWPSKYHFAIYRIVSNLCGWIGTVKHLPSDQENIQLESLGADHENGNIPKSCMIALGEITKHLLVTDKLNDNFKQYIMDIIYHRYFELKKNENTCNYAQAFINSIRSGGHEMLDIPLTYKKELFDKLNGFDQIPYIEYSKELKRLLTADIAESVEGSC